MARPKSDRPTFRLEQLGSRFYVRWWEDGTKRRIPTGTADRREAQRFLAQFEAGYGVPEPPAQLTIRQILAGYLNDRRGQVASIATLEACEKALVRHLGDLEPAHLTRERSHSWADRAAAQEAN